MDPDQARGESIAWAVVGAVILYLLGGVVPEEDGRRWVVRLSLWAVGCCVIGMMIHFWACFIQWQISRMRRDRAEGPIRRNASPHRNPLKSLWLLNGLVVSVFGWALLTAKSWMVAHSHYYAVNIILNDLSVWLDWPIVATLSWVGRLLLALGIGCCVWPITKWMRGNRPSWQGKSARWQWQHQTNPFSDLRGRK